MSRTQIVAYGISGLAVLSFFLIPQPEVAVVGALVLQTLAFIIVAGRFPVDGLLLTGISFLLLGLLPADHPFVVGSQVYHKARWALLGIGATLVIAMLTVAIYRSRS